MEMAMAEDIVRVLKIVEYVGPRSAVERALTVNGSWTMRKQSDGVVIRTAIVGQYPEVLEQAKEEPEPEPVSEMTPKQVQDSGGRYRKCGGFTTYARQNSASGLCFTCEIGPKP